MKSEKELVMGVGLNDVTLPTWIVDNGASVLDPYYKVWKNMLTRCYNEKYKEQRPSYKDCYVCNEWLTFSNFKAWMEKQDWKGKHLDKDLLVSNNKMYSPDTCVFISKKTNSGLLLNVKSRGSSPLGCSYHKNRKYYQSNCNNGDGKTVYLGSFDTAQAAHRAWQAAKIEIIESFKEKEIDPRAVKGLQRVIDKISLDYKTYTETKNF